MLPPSSNMLISILFETILGHTTKRQLIYAAFFEVCDVYKHTHTNLATFNVPSFFVPRVATQCLFLVLFPFLPVPLYVALLVALRSSEVQFPTATTKRTNTHTNVVLQAPSWKGQRAYYPSAREQTDGTSQPKTGRTQNTTEQDRTKQDMAGQADQNKAEVQQEKNQKQKRQRERPTYKGCSAGPQCLFLVLFHFFSSAALCSSYSCTEIQ